MAAYRERIMSDFSIIFMYKMTDGKQSCPYSHPGPEDIKLVSCSTELSIYFKCSKVKNIIC